MNTNRPKISISPSVTVPQFRAVHDTATGGNLDKENIRAAIDSDRPRLCHTLGLKEQGGRFFCPECQNDGKPHRSPDFSVEAGFKCHKCGASFDAFSLVQAVRDLTFKDALQWLADYTGQARPNAPVKATATARAYATINQAIEAAREGVSRQTGEDYELIMQSDYQNAEGAHVAAVLRFHALNGEPRKQYRPIHSTVDGWKIGDPPGLWPLYRLAEIIASSGPVYLTEGEKAADAATSIGIIATTTAHGSQSAQKTDLSPLAGLEVVNLPDNDEAGREYARTVTALLSKLSPPAKVKIVSLPRLPAKGDMVDFLEMRDAQEPEDLRAEVERLAAGVNAEQPEQPKTESDFPAIVSAATFTASPMPEPTQVIQGVLHAGSKAVYGGPSKAFKSWSLIDMCLAVSTGGDWLGFPTSRGRVLYVNFELQPFALHRRLHAIAKARGCNIPGNLELWNLRGYGCPLTRLLPDLLKRIEGEGYSLIVPDPIYKTLEGRNENDAGDIGALCGELESVAVKTGAAVAFGAHFAKGNASGKESIDRVSGSGVWARDPDAIITATPHETDSAFTVEMTLRNFPPPEPFVIRWEYPQMIRDGALDPARLRQAQRRGGSATVRPEMETLIPEAVNLAKAKPINIPIFRGKLYKLAGTQGRARELYSLLIAEGHLSEFHERGRGKHEAWIGIAAQIKDLQQRTFNE